MSVDWNKNMVREFWLGVFNDRDLSLVDKYISPNYTFNGEHQTKDQIKDFARSIWATFPDVHFTILDLLGDGDKVAIRYTIVGTRASTGQKEQTMATNIVTVENQLGVSNWQTWDGFRPVKGDA